MKNKEIKRYLKRKLLDEYHFKIGLDNFSHFSTWDYKLRTKVWDDENDGDDMLLVLDGELIRPPAGSDAGVIMAWEKLDRKVRRILLNSVNWTFYYFINGNRTAHEMYAEIQSSIIAVTGSEGMGDFLTRMESTKNTNREAQEISKLGKFVNGLSRKDTIELFILLEHPSLL
ncbi:hypothetical protein HDU81_003370 [Chytriomyces hyalinus]|nr:hypothetical protein HDU81_003370 [Chytriomyces hyalinus]